MASNITMEDYVYGDRSGVYGTVHFPDLETVDRSLRTSCRRTLWNTLNGISMKGVILNDSEFLYLSHDPAIMHGILWKSAKMDDIVKGDVVIKFTKKVTSLLVVCCFFCLAYLIPDNKPFQ